MQNHHWQHVLSILHLMGLPQLSRAVLRPVEGIGCPMRELSVERLGLGQAKDVVVPRGGEGFLKCHQQFGIAQYRIVV